MSFSTDRSDGHAVTVDGKSDDDIRRLVAGIRSIALVGASPKPHRPSNGVLAYLARRGFELHPVNPGIAGRELHGARVAASLAELEGPVDMVDVFRNSAAAAETIDEVLALPWRPKVVWLQLGVIAPEAARRAEAAGIAVVMDRCPAIEFPRLGI